MMLIKCLFFVSAKDHKLEFIYLNDGADFLKWKEWFLFIIKIHDLDYALHEEAPRVRIENSVEGKEYEKWDKSNNFSLLMMKSTISSDIKKEIPNSVYAKEYLASIEKHFKDVITR